MSEIVFHTKRLRCRRMNQADFDQLYAMFNDPIVMRYYPCLFDKVQTQAWLDKVLHNYHTYGYGLYAVENKESGDFLGQVGLHHQVVEGVDEAELGYLLKSQFHGKGYATEAAFGTHATCFYGLENSSGHFTHSS